MTHVHRLMLAAIGVAAALGSGAALPVAAPAAENQDEPTKPGEGAEVVRLDRFRKK